MPKQIYTRKKILKKGVQYLFFGWFLTHFDELKTLKNIEKRGGCAHDFGTHFGNPRLPKPSRVCYRRVPADTLTQKDNIKKRWCEVGCSAR
jgi:hypothetical protein